MKLLLLCLCIPLFLFGCEHDSVGQNKKISIYVAAHNSSRFAKSTADVVCDGNNDQDDINMALKMLSAGGSVTLAAGDYDIRKSEGYGGINIVSDNVTLQGEGTATRLVLADNQDCNVIRIYGVNNVTVSSLYVDANGNNQAVAPDTVENKYQYFRRFEFELSGIMSRRYNVKGKGIEGYSDSQEPTNIVVDDCYVKDAKGLNIMLFGNNVAAINNVIYDTENDGIEVLGGPGKIINNTVVVTRGIGDAAIGTDAASGVTISGNTILVGAKAVVSYAIRTWYGSGYSTITNNQVVIEDGANVKGAIESRSNFTTISNNLINNMGKPTIVSFTAGTMFSNNVIRNCEIGHNISSFWKDSNIPLQFDNVKSIATANILVNSSFVKCAAGLIQEFNTAKSNDSSRLATKDGVKLPSVRSKSYKGLVHKASGNTKEKAKKQASYQEVDNIRLPGHSDAGSLGVVN